MPFAFILLCSSLNYKSSVFFLLYSLLKNCSLLLLYLFVSFSCSVLSSPLFVSIKSSKAALFQSKQRIVCFLLVSPKRRLHYLYSTFGSSALSSHSFLISLVALYKSLLSELSHTLSHSHCLAFSLSFSCSSLS